MDTALTRPAGKELGGISYTMWSNSQYTLCTTSNDWNFVGELNNNINNNRLCDAVFVVPTVRSTAADPNNTLGPGAPFDGRTGIGFDEQNNVKYRKSNTLTDSTTARKIYTMDRMRCMERIGATKSYQTDFTYVPVPNRPSSRYGPS